MVTAYNVTRPVEKDIIEVQPQMGIKHIVRTKMRERERVEISEFWPRPRKCKRKPTCKPLPIMRLTALLPPPPTPTTLILADSIGAKEQLTTPKRCCFRKVHLLWWRHSLKGNVFWWNGVGIEEVEISSLGFVSWSVAIATGVRDRERNGF